MCYYTGITMDAVVFMVNLILFTMSVAAFICLCIYAVRIIKG
nr:MAG TPA: hypothetical protein [Caudoviricetes sp.]